MLPRLLPSSATDVESDSDSLASPLDAPIAHVNIARRSSYRLLESSIHDISRPSDYFDGTQGAYAPYVMTNSYRDIPYEIGCSQGPYLATVQAPGQSPGEPQTLPNVIPSGLYGLAPYPDAQDDSPQYSAVSDSAVNHQNWDYLQETDVSDSPTSAVSEPFSPQHDRGDYVHGFEAQYSNAATDYEASGCHSDHAQYAVACDRRTGGYTASAGADMLPDYAVQQGSMSSGCDAGVEYAHCSHNSQPLPIVHDAGRQYAYDHPAHDRSSPHSYPGRGQNYRYDHHFGGLAASHVSQVLTHDRRNQALQYGSTLADQARSDTSHIVSSSHGHAMVSSLPRHDRYVYPTFDYSPSPSPSSQHPPSIHAPQPKTLRPVPIAMQQDYHGNDDVSQSSIPMAPPYQVLSIPTAPPPPPPAPLRHSAPVEDTPKKPLTLACFFCRKRKIACGSPPPGKKDRTCNQCARRNLKCVYPEASRRGMRPKLLYDARDTLTVPTIPAILS